MFNNFKSRKIKYKKYCLYGPFLALIYISIWLFFTIQIFGNSGALQSTNLRRTTSTNANITPVIPQKTAEPVQIIPTKGDKKCNELYGYKKLEQVKNTKNEICSNGISSITCYDMSFEGNPSSKPHKVCQGSDIVLNMEKMNPARCPNYRGSYFCAGDSSYYSYDFGAFGASCVAETSLSAIPWSKDLYKDMMESFDTSLTESQLDSVKKSDDTLVLDTVFLVTREKDEVKNLHCMTGDLLATFYSSKLLNVDLKKIAVLFLDDHRQLELENLWRNFFLFDGTKRNNQLLKLKNLKNRYKNIYIKNSIFVPPGYQSISWIGRNNEISSYCSKPVDVVLDFTNHMKRHKPQIKLKDIIKKADWFEQGITSNEQVLKEITINITLITRSQQRKFTSITNKNFQTFSKNLDKKSFFKSVKIKYNFIAIDLATLDLNQQMYVITNTDILLGAHGAGMTYLNYIRSGGAVGEIKDSPSNWPYTFKRYAEKAGIFYKRIDAKYLQKDGITQVQVNLKDFEEKFRVFVSQIISKRLRLAVE